jgi:hypothetical protein
VALALSGAPSRADDRVATLGAGGLSLEKTDKIALVSEDLYLSPTAVKVSYRFRNLTNADVETIVALPMPDVTRSVFETVEMPDPAHDNFLRFVTRVDGKPVDSQVEQRAFLEDPDKPDVEITERLKSLGVPLIPTMRAAGAALSALSELQLKALADAKIVYTEDAGGGKGANTERSDAALEVLAQAGLSGGEDLRVEQTYTPGLAGGWFDLGPPGPRRGWVSDYRKIYCTDGPSRVRSVSLPLGQRAQFQARNARECCPMSSRPALGGADRNLPSCCR